MEALIMNNVEEKDLELVVSQQKLGSLITNAEQIKSVVLELLPKYDVANYNESNIDSAKKDKALLNKTAKALNDKRIEIEKEFNKPFQEFKETIAETVKLIGECSSKIDLVVKQSEANAKEAKRKQIEQLWADQQYAIVPLQKVFDEKWLNKTASLKSIQADMVSIIRSIEDDIKTIQTLESDTKLLTSIYLDTLNINSTIQYANKLKENQRLLEQQAAAAKSPAVEKIEVHAEQVNPFEPTPATQKEKLLERTMRVYASYDQLVALGDFMNDNGIRFERI